MRPLSHTIARPSRLTLSEPDRVPLIKQGDMPGAPLSEVLRANRDLSMLIQRRNEAVQAWIDKLAADGVDPSAMSDLIQIKGPDMGKGPFVTGYLWLLKSRFPAEHHVFAFVQDPSRWRAEIKAGRAYFLVVDCTPKIAGAIDAVTTQDSRAAEDARALVAPEPKRKGKRVYGL
jgi:hypothetical protein